MTTQTLEPTLFQAKELDSRNKEVIRSYSKVVTASKALLKPFTNVKYRTVIEIDHSKSGKETNLIMEFMTCFFNITLTKNRADYNMIYITYDSEAIARFGARLYNRVLRQLFKHTMLEKGKSNAEDAVRVNLPGQVENFFVNRLTNGGNSFIKISVVEKD